MSDKQRTGGISVETSHIFPIIKKWLYSEKEIFLRELVSNACDAITKLRRLSSLGEYDGAGESYRIDVRFSKTNKTITVSDNGIGMTGAEVERYLCQMALSGAHEFVDKYEGTDGSTGGIIGHFGLGFYSAFMVADSVDVTTRSYTDDPAVLWECSESGEYTFSEAERESHGTDIVLHINSDGEEYLSEYKLREILDRYCAFMPVEIYLTDEDKEASDEAVSAVNDVAPLWQKNASDCTEEEYNKFYTKVFSDYREPLFHLHLNADYPLNFKGILFFPKLRENYESLEGKIKLYYNQVFVADNIKEVIPEYLLMLRGVLDCPELPLNVSRSYLQNSAYVSKVSAYIVRKVADKLTSMMNLERENYEKIYGDIKTFIEYACICDRKFYDRVSSALLFRDDGGKLITLDDYLSDISGEEKTVYYTTDVKMQASYISMYRDRGYRVLVLDTMIDTKLVEMIEQYRSDDKLRFRRVDADTDALKTESEINPDHAMSYFVDLSTDSMKLTVTSAALHNADIPAVLTVSEESRRMEDMMRMYGQTDFSIPLEATLTINSGCDIILKLNDGEYGDNSELIARYIYSMALLSVKKLDADEMKRFISDSTEVLRII